MKIIFFTQNLGNYISGGRQYSWFFAHCLAKLGHEVQILTNAIPLFDRDFQDFPGRERISIHKDAWYGVKEQKIHKKILVADMIIGTPMESVDYAISTAKRYKKTSMCLIFEPLNMIEDAIANGIEIPFDFSAETTLDFTKQIVQSDFVVCNNVTTEEWTKKWLSQTRFSGKVINLYNGILSNKAEKVSIKTERENSVTFLGRMEKYKGFGEILYVFGDYPKRENLKIHLIVGSIDKNNIFVKNFFQECVKHKVDLIVHEKITEEEKFEILSKTKLLIAPSRHEGFGLTLAEAFYLRTPVVCYDLPVYREVYKDYPEYVDLGNLVGFKEKVIDVLENGTNTNLDEAKSLVESFATVNRYCDNLSKIFTPTAKKEKPKQEFSNLDKITILAFGDTNFDSQTYKEYDIMRIKDWKSFVPEKINNDKVLLVRDGLNLNRNAFYNLAVTMKYTDADFVYGNYDCCGKRIYVPNFSLEMAMIKPFSIYGCVLMKKQFIESIVGEQFWEFKLVEKFHSKKWCHCCSLLFQTDKQVEDLDMTERINGLIAPLTVNRITNKTYDVEFPKKDEKTLVIIPARTNKYFEKCYNSLLESKAKLDVVVCHHEPSGNFSADLLDFCQKANIKVMKSSGPFNYSTINNEAFNRMVKDHKYVILLNDDVILKNDAINKLLGTFSIPKYEKLGVVGAKLVYPAIGIPTCWEDPKFLIQHASVILLKDVFCTHIHRMSPAGKHCVNILKEVDAVTFAFVAIDTDCFNEVTLDEELNNEFNDIDFCIRAKAKGWKIVYNPFSIAIHYESITRREFDILIEPENRKLFKARHLDLLNKQISLDDMRRLEASGL